MIKHKPWFYVGVIRDLLANGEAMRDGFVFRNLKFVSKGVKR
jgi:hypothetical protein